MRVEWRVVMERPGLHDPSPYRVENSREMAEVTLRKERKRYMRTERGVRVWLEARRVASWEPADG
jgi:hypothetical protein